MYLLILFSDTGIISVSEYSPGTAVASQYEYITTTREKAILIFTFLGIEDLSQLDVFGNDLTI